MGIRIALDGRVLTDHYPGIGRYLWNLVRALPRVAGDDEIYLLTREDEDNSRYPIADLEAAGVRRVPVKESLRGLRQQVTVPRRLGELGVQVFHAPYYLTAYRVPCPMVVTVCDVIGILHPDDLPSALMRKTYRVALQTALRSATTVLTLSRTARDDLVSHFDVDPERIVMTPAAADPSLEAPPAEAAAEVRERLRLPERYVLHVGTNKPHKNLVRLLEAWAAVSTGDGDEKSRSDWQLVLAGRHDDRYPEAREKARELGLNDVRFLGEVAESDLAAVYAGAGLFVLPSLAEGFGLPVLEAMACGTAVACSRTSSLPALAGAAAAYFDPEDPGSIAATLTRLLKNGGYREILAERGARQAGHFTWEKTARQTLKAYRRLAGGGSGTATSTHTRR